VPSTAANASKDGGKESFVVFDETHLYVLAELVRMYATVRRNLAKRKSAEPWSLETSTMYLPGQGSVAEETHKLAKAIADKKSRTARLLFDHREGPPDVDLTDEKALVAALREAYGPFADVMDLDRILAEIWDPRNTPSDSRRYFLNQRTGAEDAWLVEHEWKARLDVDRVVTNREPITLGFDGSRRRARGVTDATALIACTVTDGHLFEPLERCVWEQPSGPAGVDWQVPTGDVDAAVQEVFRRYNVVGFFGDPAKWESYIAGWEASYAKKLKVKASRNHPIEWWMTGGRSVFIVRALEQFHDAVIDGELTHDGSFALTRHVLNARRRPSRSGLQIAKENPESPNKIDAAIAAVLAWQARLAALAAGVGRRGSTYVPKRIR
jgi:phage terminase large subunit-like protein